MSNQTKVVMRKYLILSLLSLMLASSLSANTCSNSNCSNAPVSFTYSQSQAKLTFRNKSDYTMTLKVLYAGGGLYSTIVLQPHSSKVMTFGKSDSFKLKIKAEHYGSVSYHDGGNFSITCTETQWTEGEMSFSLSTYGSGLGPSISKSEFEKNY